MKFGVKIIIAAFFMMFVNFNVFSKGISDKILDRLAAYYMGVSTEELAYSKAVPVYSRAKAKFSPDGNKIAAGYYSGEIIIWDANTYNPISVYNGENDYWSLDFSPDGKYIAYGARHEAVTLFDVENNCVVKTFPVERSGIPMAVKFSPDGRYIAAGYGVHKIIIWDVETGSIVYRFETSNSVPSVAFSPDGKRLISADDDYGIDIWNMENGRHERRLTGNFRYDKFLAVFYRVIINKSGDRLISGSQIRREITIWDTESGKKIKTLPGNRYSVYSLCISPDGNTIAAGSDNMISLWDISSGSKLLTISKKFLFDVSSMVFHPNNSNILMTAGSPEGLIKLWDTTNGELITELSIEQILPDRKGNRGDKYYDSASDINEYFKEE
jgi:WD40 repeat protein